GGGGGGGGHGDGGGGGGWGGWGGAGAGRQGAPTRPRMSGCPDQGRRRRAPACARRSFAPAGPCSEPRAAFVRTPPANAAEGHQAQASAGAQSPPRSQPGLSAAAAWLRTWLICGVAGGLTGNDAIHALAVRLLVLTPKRAPLAHSGRN